MNELSAVLHDPTGAAPLARFWAGATGRPATFEPEERLARREVLTQHFAGALEALAAAFHGLARDDLATRDTSRAALRRALETILSAFPAYRSYGADEGATSTDRWILERARTRARALAQPGEAEAIDLVFEWLAGRGPGAPEARRAAVRRFQQLSAPVSAKAVEDTAFYRYGRLLSRNDVGFDPERLSTSIADFHAWSAARAAHWPSTMTTTATHDHKRGEDVRARLAVLSTIPHVWKKQAGRWLERVSALAPEVAPDDGLNLLQTIVGAWPLDLEPSDADGLAGYISRLAEWQTKALREAKLRSSWLAPDHAYESSARALLDAALGPGAGDDVVEIARFADEIAPAGALNGLAQALLRCTAPGVPDLYQGRELWDFSLVDPDNRRAVDFRLRAELLAQRARPSELLRSWRDGRVKQALIAHALCAQRAARAPSGARRHHPVGACGPRSGNVIAFLTRQDERATLTVAPIRFSPQDVPRDDLTPPSDWWKDTFLPAPFGDEATAGVNALTGETVDVGERVYLRDLLADMPLALVRRS